MHNTINSAIMLSIDEFDLELQNLIVAILEQQFRCFQKGSQIINTYEITQCWLNFE